MPTMQSLVDAARDTLNDADKVRWTDAVLLMYSHRALELLLAKRPDLFFGQFAAPPVDPVLADDFPLDVTVLPPVVDYVIARAHSRDSEEAIATKAASFFQLMQLDLA
jgi:hypothetical protein